MKLDHPAAKSEFMTNLDLEAGFEKKNGDLFLLVPDRRRPSGYRPERVSEQTLFLRELRIDRGKPLYKDAKLLFPTRRHGKARPIVGEVPAQQQVVAIRNVTNELEAVIGFRITVREIELLLAYWGISAHPKEALSISDALGIKYPSNFLRKMSAVLEKKQQ